mmetsp:Transcript_28383/g.25106  ORF Transcript_28383/g.25106 Transcript_28383/m.25106 type:complete len:217 (-) Transcript_28383:14-664(-)
MTNTSQYGDPVSSSYQKYKGISETAYTQDNREEPDETALINSAMKMNESLAGNTSNQSLANQFYYQLPDPSLPYSSDLQNYRKDAYKVQAPAYQEPAYQGQAQAYQGQAQAYQRQAPAYDYAAYQNPQYPQGYNYSYPYAQPGYDYSAYYHNYYQQYPQAQPQNGVKQPMTEHDISVKHYEDINREDIFVSPMHEDDIKEMNKESVIAENVDMLLF